MDAHICFFVIGFFGVFVLDLVKVSVSAFG